MSGLRRLLSFVLKHPAPEVSEPDHSKQAIEALQAVGNPTSVGGIRYFYASADLRYFAFLTEEWHTLVVDSRRTRYCLIRDASPRHFDGSVLELEGEETRMQAYSTFTDIVTVDLESPEVSWVEVTETDTVTDAENDTK